MLKNEIPIGIPKEDVEIFIVDDNKKNIQDGNIGEILICGESVSAGYIGDIENKSFINYNHKNAYLTGDLGLIKDGILYYKCRKDKQVKFKGYRIELSDIEKNIQEINGVEKAVVLKKIQNNKIMSLIGFVKLYENIEKKEDEIYKELHSTLPKYMCPKIIIVKEFPINKNGKCDERKLLEEY